MTHDFTPEEFKRRSPALFKRWLKTHEGKRWTADQDQRAKKQAAMSTRHPNRRRHWNAEEEDYLRRHWGTQSLLRFSKHFQRSQRAVSTHARDLGLGPATAAHGAMSLRQFSRHSGFSATKIRRAAEKLQINLATGLNSEAGSANSRNRRRTRRVYQRSRTLAITPEQQELLLAHMLKKS